MALAKLMQEDPTFRVHTDKDTGQTMISRHGRAAPRDHHRPPGARVQRRRQRRQAAGRLPRDDHRGGRGRRPVRPPDRRPRPVRPRQDPHAADDRGGLRLQQQDRRRRHPQGVHQADRAGHQGGAGDRSAGGLSRAPASRSTSTTAPTTTSTPRRSRSRSPARWPTRTPARRARPVLMEPIMAVEVVDARGVHGRRHRRHHVAARPDPAAWRRAAAPR